MCNNARSSSAFLQTDRVRGECKDARMDFEQDATRRYLREILRITGWTPSQLASRAGVRHSTLTRFLNNEDVTHTLSARTLGKVRDAAAREIPGEQLDTLWLLSRRVPPQPATHNS